MLIDYRRELYETVPEEYRLGYAVGVDMLRQIVDGAARAMKNRVPPAELPPSRIKLRDWWDGPELFIVVDDYDLLGGSSSTHPFAPVLDHLAQGTEIGLHLIVARSANGAAEAWATRCCASCRRSTPRRCCSPARPRRATCSAM